jgi:hypothetical protein
MAGVLSRSKSLKLFLLRVILDYSIIFGLNSSKEIGIHSTVLSISKSLRTNNWKFSILLFSIYGFQPSFQVSQRWFKSKYMISVAGISCYTGLCLKHSDPFTVLLRVIQWWKNSSSIVIMIFFVFPLIHNFCARWLYLCLELKVVNDGLL